MRTCEYLGMQSTTVLRGMYMLTNAKQLEQDKIPRHGIVNVDSTILLLELWTAFVERYRPNNAEKDWIFQEQQFLLRYRDQQSSFGTRILLLAKTIANCK